MVDRCFQQRRTLRHVRALVREAFARDAAAALLQVRLLELVQPLVLALVLEALACVVAGALLEVRLLVLNLPLVLALVPRACP